MRSRRALVSAALLACGCLLGLGIRAAERVAYACSCVEEGGVGGEFVEIRRVSGTGDPATQDWWQDLIGISVPNESTAVASTTDPNRPDLTVDLNLISEPK